ncbi:MAG: hypothetical protein ACERKV_03000 [Clostridiaceae bacterium]
MNKLEEIMKMGYRIELALGGKGNSYLDIYGLMGFSNSIEHKSFKADKVDEVINAAYQFTQEDEK